MNMAYEQNQRYGQRSSYGGQQQQRSRPYTVRGKIDFADVRQGRTGKEYFVIGIKGVEYSTFDPSIFDDAETALHQDLELAFEVVKNGKYYNIEGPADPNAKDQTPSSQVRNSTTSSSNGREEYWQRKFEFETTIAHQAIIRMNAIGNARQIVKDLKDLGLLNLDKYTKKSASPQEVYLNAVYEIAEDIVSHVNEQENPEDEQQPLPRRVTERQTPPPVRGDFETENNFPPGG